MKIIVRAKNIKLNPVLRQHIQRMVNSLEKFVKISRGREYLNGFFRRGKSRVTAMFEIEKETTHHQKGKVFRAEAQVKGFPKKSARAVASAEDLRMAINMAKEKLERQFKQYGAKIFAQTKRGSRALKRSFRFASGAKFKEKKGARIRDEGI